MTSKPSSSKASTASARTSGSSSTTRTTGGLRGILLSTPVPLTLRHPPQHARHFLGRVGLLEEFEAVQTLLDQHMAVARGQDDGQIWMTALDFAAEIHATHPWHDHVRKHHVEPGPLRFKNLESLIGICGPDGLVAEVLQDLCRELPNLDIVLDDEYATSLPGLSRLRSIRTGFCALCGSLAVSLRQEE